MDRLRQRFPHALDMEQITITQQGLLDSERLKEMTKRSKEEVVLGYVEETWPDGLGEFGERFVTAAVRNTMREDPA
jgi:hypothetical protein